MIISKTKMTSEVKDKFNELFPGLKLEFFKKSHENNQLSRKEDLIEDDMQLLSLNSELKDGEIDLNSSKSVSQIEEEMNENFGLNVQVYRKSNNIWLQTSKTDHWSLAVQNRKGLNSSQ